MNEPSNFLTDALGYAARGWSIIPIKHRPGKDGEKKPTVKWKPYQTSLPTDNDLREWFARKDLNGLAVVLGDGSGGLCVRDFDKTDAYRAWAVAHPDLANTLPTVATARGFHVYFMCRGMGLFKMPDGELRGNGGYVLLPPSRHHTGPVYSWLVHLPDGELPTIDPERVGLLTEKTERQRMRRSQRGQRNRETETLHPPSLPSLTAQDERIQRAILQTLPDEHGHRNRIIFGFLRRLKALPELADQPVQAIKPLVQAWHLAALPTIGTKDFDTTWADVVYGWPRVKYPWGTGPLASIIETAESMSAPKCAEHYTNPTARLLVSMCAEMQRLEGTRPFYLAVRTAGDALEIDRTTAGKLLGMLAADGIIVEVVKGTQKKGATRWKYIGGLEDSQR